MPRSTPAPSPRRAIAYLRCSTHRHDLSPDAQREDVAAWAGREGVEMVAWQEDRGVSGGVELEGRPGPTAAVVDFARLGAGVPVVARRYPLARDVLTVALVERLAERCGARGVPADGTGNGDSPEAAPLHDRRVLGLRTRPRSVAGEGALAVTSARLSAARRAGP